MLIHVFGVGWIRRRECDGCSYRDGTQTMKTIAKKKKAFGRISEDIKGPRKEPESHATFVYSPSLYIHERIARYIATSHALARSSVISYHVRRFSVLLSAFLVLGPAKKMR